MDNNNSPNPTISNINPKKKSSAGKIALIIVAILVAIGLIVGAYFFGQHEKNKAVEAARKEAAADQQKKDADSNKTAAQTTDNKTTPTPAKTHTDPSCNADELSLAISDGQGTAGGQENILTIKNSGSRECTLYGYPGVSLVNANGNMIGQPADRTSSGDAETVTLAAGASVTATLVMPSSANLPDGQCVSGAVKVRVYPPNDVGYLSAPTTTLTTWCPGFKTGPVKAS